MERVTCGKKEPSPGSSCSVYADDELQLLYACDKGRCEYKMSVPQIVLQQNCSNAIRCVCNYALYLPNMNLYTCPQVSGGCGFCIHELDSLTYMAVQKFNDGQYGWVRKTAPMVCRQRGLLKYILNERSMKGELVYQCRHNNVCNIVSKDLLPHVTVLNNGVEI